MKQIRECEDCGDEVKSPHRRIRCKHCKKLICGWCYNHVHGILWWNGVTEEMEMEDAKKDGPV